VNERIGQRVIVRSLDGARDLGPGTIIAIEDVEIDDSCGDSACDACGGVGVFDRDVPVIRLDSGETRYGSGVQYAPTVEPASPA
jgi:hypothetical protein